MCRPEHQTLLSDQQEAHGRCQTARGRIASRRLCRLENPPRRGTIADHLHQGVRGPDCKAGAAASLQQWFDGSSGTQSVLPSAGLRGGCSSEGLDTTQHRSKGEEGVGCDQRNKAVGEDEKSTMPRHGGRRQCRDICSRRWCSKPPSAEPAEVSLRSLGESNERLAKDRELGGREANGRVHRWGLPLAAHWQMLASFLPRLWVVHRWPVEARETLGPASRWHQPCHWFF